MSVLKIKNENNEWESVPVINGEDGFSPTITTSKVGKETTLTITDINGTSTATILDGEDGTGPRGMAKATYDTNDNGIVDNAEKVNNHTVLSDVPANAVFTDTTYTAGTGIAINNGVISNTQTSAEWGNITGTLSNQTDLNNALGGKQPTLVSGTNIKTINNNSILGSGDLSIQEGETLPVGTEVDYDGLTVPTGWEQVSESNILYKVLSSGTNIDNIATFGFYGVLNATGTLPTGYSTSDNNVFIQSMLWGNGNYGRQVLYDIRSNNTYTRQKNNGHWQSWVSLI